MTTTKCVLQRMFDVPDEPVTANRVRISRGGGLDIDTGTYTYSISGSDIATPEAVLWWCHHLSLKKWCDDRLMREIIEKIGYGSNQPVRPGYSEKAVAMVSEQAYRRGFQQGHAVGGKVKAEQVTGWRFGSKNDRSPPPPGTLGRGSSGNQLRPPEKP